MTQPLLGGSPRWPQEGDVLSAVLQALPDYLLTQRWYSGKGVGRASVTLKTLLPLESEGINAALAIWHASVAGALDMDFFLPIAVFSGGEASSTATRPITTLSDGRIVIDALGIDAFVLALLQMMASGQQPTSGPLEAGHTGALGDRVLLSTAPIHRSQLEQSNTSIRIGDLAVMKVIRRVLPGVNPELEMGRFLTEEAHFEPIAALWGWLQFRGHTVAVLQAFVPNCGDGWSWIASQLQSRGHAAQTLSWIKQLGATTAQMHRALAAPTTDAAFSTQSAQPEDWRRWTAATQDMADRVLQSLSTWQLSVEKDLEVALDVESYRSAIEEVCRALRTQSPQVQLTRHHGDYHLGQVLVSDAAGVTIVDFEGEPSRDLTERRAKHVPLRDVAGMLRSFGYAAASAGRQDAYLTEWLTAATQTFLEAYFETRAIRGPDRIQALELIRFFSIEKALYEVLYEVNNRPQWVSIPLKQLLTLLAQPSPTAEGALQPCGRCMTALESLAGYVGINDSFVDARGETRATSAQTRLALLAAMGIAAGEADAGDALRTLQAQDSARVLPTVHVHDRRAAVLELELPGADPALREWQIELEHGEVCRGPLEWDRSCATSHPAALLRIADPLPDGYHTLAVGEFRCQLIVTPGECWLPDGMDSERRLWGVAAQLYLLRSERNWGIGDYGDLKVLVAELVERGADVVGLNPLHAMFTDDPEQASPYSPASRLLLNVLNIDVESLARAINDPMVQTGLEAPEFAQQLARCREARLVDYSAVAALKLPVLRKLFAGSKRDGPDWAAFCAFRSAAGDAFERSCLYLALRERFARAAPHTADWHQWPDDYRTVLSPGTLRFAQRHADEVTFQAWLQFIADRQLRECAEAGDTMAVGLYRDLAVGAASGGAETWANPSAVVDGIHVGAPPDIYNPQGQDWGLPPFNPRALREEGYRSFVELLRANMLHAGALRIDHVMALQQLYWVPSGRPPSEGAYVRYPLEDLLGILTLESHRHQCLIVGEDLGTVPEGFRDRMQQARILSYRVLFFEKDKQSYLPADAYPRLSLAVAGSHDLPTLRAWWRGADLDLKESLKLYANPSQAAQARLEREADRAAFKELLLENSLTKSGDVPEEDFVAAAHSFLASTRSAIAMLQLDDITAEIDPVNVPTTSTEHPNWRRRLSLSLEQLRSAPAFTAATEALDQRCGNKPSRTADT